MLLFQKLSVQTKLSVLFEYAKLRNVLLSLLTSSVLCSVVFRECLESYFRTASPQQQGALVLLQLRQVTLRWAETEASLTQQNEALKHRSVQKSQTINQTTTNIHTDPTSKSESHVTVLQNGRAGGDSERRVSVSLTKPVCKVA